MGYGGLADPDEARQVADASFTVSERVEKPHAGGVSQQLENFGNRRNHASGQQLFSYRGEGDRIMDMLVLPRVLGGIDGKGGIGRSGHSMII